MDDGAAGGGTVIAPAIVTGKTGDGSLAPCGTAATWPGIKRPPPGGLSKLHQQIIT